MLGTSDHGETPDTAYSRLKTLSAEILHVLFWLHIPRGMVTDQTRSKLLINRERVVSVIDLVPMTVRHLVLGGTSYTVKERNNCLTGRSLLELVLEVRFAERWHGWGTNNTQAKHCDIN